MDHYPLKLLRLAAGMHTASAQAEATRRHEFMLRFLQQIASEATATRSLH